MYLKTLLAMLLSDASKCLVASVERWYIVALERHAFSSELLQHTELTETHAMVRETIQV